MRKALLVALACLLPASAARAQVELEPKDALLHHTSCMVSSLALTPDGKTLLAGTMRSPRVIFWDVAKMKERAVHDPHSQHVFHVAMTADGKIAASVGAENSIVVWDVATAKPRNKLDGLRPHKKIVFLAFLPDNKTLITGGQEGDVKIIDTASLEEKGTFRGKVRRLDFAALSPDGKLLAAAPGALADEIQMWDVEARRPKAPLEPRFGEQVEPARRFAEEHYATRRQQVKGIVEGPLEPAGALGETAHLAEFAGEEGCHQACLAELYGPQHEGLGLFGGHAGRSREQSSGA